jgi:hypothetical protein
MAPLGLNEQSDVSNIEHTRAEARNILVSMPLLLRAGADHRNADATALARHYRGSYLKRFYVAPEHVPSRLVLDDELLADVTNRL